MRTSLATKFAILASASLLAIRHSQVLAQADPGPLIQLNESELRAALPGVDIRAVGDNLHIDGFRCDGGWVHIGYRIPAYGSYSIRDSQFCIEGTVGADYGVCAKLLRGETGKTFLQSVSRDGRATASPREVTITRAETCPQR